MRLNLKAFSVSSLIICMTALLAVLFFCPSASAKWRWESQSWTAPFRASVCGGKLKTTRALVSSGRVKHAKVVSPRVGDPLRNLKGEVFARVTRISVQQGRHGPVRATWYASPKAPCMPEVPKPVEPTPVPVPAWNADPATQEAYWRYTAAQERYQAELEDWEGANQAAKEKWQKTWGRHGAETKPVTLLVRIFRNAENHLEPKAPCTGFKCAAQHAVVHELQTNYEMNFPDVSCHVLSPGYAHCFFEGLTHEDVQQGTRHAGDAYVTRHAYGLDVQIASFHLK